MNQWVVKIELSTTGPWLTAWEAGLWTIIDNRRWGSDFHFLRAELFQIEQTIVMPEWQYFLIAWLVFCQFGYTTTNLCYVCTAPHLSAHHSQSLDILICKQNNAENLPTWKHRHKWEWTQVFQDGRDTASAAWPPSQLLKSFSKLCVSWSFKNPKELINNAHINIFPLSGVCGQPREN